MQKEIGRDSIVEVGGCYYIIDKTAPIGDGDCELINFSYASADGYKSGWAARERKVEKGKNNH